ncbi:unnamed protein product [Prunus armeniaca]
MYSSVAAAKSLVISAVLGCHEKSALWSLSSQIQEMRYEELKKTILGEESGEEEGSDDAVSDALPWQHVLGNIQFTEEDTTSSSRFFIKFLFVELSEYLGIRLLNQRLKDPALQDSRDSIFPKDNPKNTSFAINFFTSIGLSGITEKLRDYLKQMPRLCNNKNRCQTQNQMKKNMRVVLVHPSRTQQVLSLMKMKAIGTKDTRSAEGEKSYRDERDRKRRTRVMATVLIHSFFPRTTTLALLLGSLFKRACSDGILVLVQAHHF